jgi:hypothetical protein
MGLQERATSEGAAATGCRGHCWPPLITSKGHALVVSVLVPGKGEAGICTPALYLVYILSMSTLRNHS